jgi:heme/copper-type cytochrome/quinol oxidase subunit 1
MMLIYCMIMIGESNTTLFGSFSMILALLAINVLGCIVWAHHMYVVNLDCDSVLYFIVLTCIIGIPTGNKVVNWLNTLIVRIMRHGLYIYLTGFLMLFGLGGFTGIVLSNSSIDVYLHDSLYVVAHFHYVLSIGAVVGIIMGLGYCSCRIEGEVSGSCLLVMWSRRGLIMSL